MSIKLWTETTIRMAESMLAQDASYADIAALMTEHAGRPVTVMAVKCALTKHGNQQRLYGGIEKEEHLALERLRAEERMKRTRPADKIRPPDATPKGAQFKIGVGYVRI